MTFSDEFAVHKEETFTNIIKLLLKVDDTFDPHVT